MRAGNLKHRISLHSSTATANGFGEEAKTWTSYASAWASIEPLQGREIEYAKSIHAEAQFKITIRYNSVVAVVTPSHRVLFGSRIFEINAVQNVMENDRNITLYCKEIV